MLICKAGRGRGQWLLATGRKQSNPTASWIRSATEIKYGHCCGSREESEYGTPSATSVSQLCNALGSQELLVLNLLCSCGPSPAVLVHLVVTLLCWVWWGSVLKSLYVPTMCQEVVSQRLGSHHHFLMPDIPNKFLTCMSVHFILQALWYTLRMSNWNHCHPLLPISEDLFVLEIEKQASQEVVPLFFSVFTVIDLHLYAFLSALWTIFPCLCF